MLLILRNGKQLVKNARGCFMSTSNPNSSVVSVMPSIKTLSSTLHILQNHLKNKSADDAMHVLQTIHDMKVVIPLTFLTDTIDILTFRRDAVRTELLLRLATANFSLMRASSSLYGTKSKPVHLPLNKLMSYAISGLIRAGVYDEAFHLWLKVTNDGYLTNRVSIEQLMQRVSVASAAPPEEFIDRVHSTMKDNRWHNSSRYYSLILAIVRQHLTWCADLSSLRRGLARYDTLSDEAATVSGGGPPSADMVAIHLQCLCAAAVAARRLDSHADSLRQDCLSRAVRLHTSSLSPHDGLIATSLRTPTNAEDISNLIGHMQKQVTSAGSRVHVGGLVGAAGGGRGAVRSAVHDDLRRGRTRLEAATATLAVELAAAADMENIRTVISAHLTLASAPDTENWMRRCFMDVVEAYNHPSVEREKSIRLLVSLLSEEYSKWTKRTGFSSSGNLCITDELLVGVIGALRPGLDWRGDQMQADAIADEISPQVKASDDYKYAVIKMLAARDSKEAILHAFSILSSIKPEGNLNAKDVISHGSFLKSATAVLDMPSLQTIVKAFDKKLSQVKHFDEDFQLTRIMAYAKVLDGVAALRILNKVSSSSDGNKRIPLRVFNAVINALYLFEPEDKTGKDIINDAASTCRFIVELMTRQGQPITPHIGASMLNIFSKTAKLLCEDRQMLKDLFSSAEEFCSFLESSIQSSGREELRVGLIKMYCVCGEMDLALKVLSRNETDGVQVTALSYEPIIFYYAAINRQLFRAEDILTTMLNNFILISPSIIDAFVKGTIYTRDVKGALDRAQDLYNQHNVKPTADCILSLLKINLEEGDLYESRRVVGVMKSMRMIQTDEYDRGITNETINRLFERYGIQ